MRRLLAVAALAAASAVSAQDAATPAGEAAAPAPAVEHVRFYGYATDRDSGRYLYTELHEYDVRGAHALQGTITYFGADGARIAHKVLDYRTDPFVPLFRLDMPYLRYAEGLTDNGDPVKVYREEDGKRREAALEHASVVAADSGFHHLLVDHFDELMGGQTVKFRFIVAGGLDSYRFRVRRIADTTFEGRPAVRFVGEADSILRLVAPELEVVYDPQTRYLLDYRGPSNLHDPATGAPWTVHIAYGSVPPPGAPALPPLDAPPVEAARPPLQRR